MGVEVDLSGAGTALSTDGDRTLSRGGGVVFRLTSRGLLAADRPFHLVTGTNDGNTAMPGVVSILRGFKEPV